jgi:hypothetical protein
MANNLGALTVSLGLDAAEYMRGLTKSEYEAKKTSDRLTKQFQQAAAAIGSIGAGAFLASSIKSTTDFAREIENLSRIAGVSAQEMQAFSYAAQTVGFSTEKLADVFKDVQDKVGDFLQTGGGPLADFFENIAPKIGVTAEQFRNLSGKDALQLYVSSLEKANVSQNEMVFFMEAIASDATALLPLLRDNGSEFARLAVEAENLGVVLDESAIKAAKELSNTLTQFNAISDGVIRQIASALIPSINELGNEFLTGTRNANGFFDALFTFGLINPFKSTGENLKTIRQDIQGLEDDRKRALAANSDTSGIDQALQTAAKRLAYLKDLERQAVSIGKDDQSSAEARRLGLQVAPTPRLASTQNAKDIAAADKAAKDRARILQKERDEELKLKREASIQGGLAVEAENEAIQKSRKKLEEELLVLKREASIAGGLAVEAENKAIQKTREEYDRWIKTVKESTLEGKAAAQTAEINKLFEAVEAGRLSWDEYEQASSKALGLTGEALKKGKNFASELGLTFSSAFEDAIVSGKGFSEVLKGLEKDILRIIVRRAVTEPLANAIGSGFSSIFSGGKAIGGDVMGGRSYMVGERGPELFTPMGNGSITPNSGGATINQTISIDARGADAGVEQRIMQAMRQTKAETLAEVQAKANRGGSFARAVGRA